MAVHDITPTIESIGKEIGHLAEVCAYLSQALDDLHRRLERSIHANPCAADFCEQRDHNGGAA